MQATGNRPPGTVENKGRWMASDMARWLTHYGIPFNMNPHFPFNSLVALRGAIAYMNDPVIRPYCDAMFRAAAECCHQHDRTSRIHAKASLEAEVEVAQRACEECDAALRELVDFYQQTAELVVPTGDDEAF